MTKYRIKHRLIPANVLGANAPFFPKDRIVEAESYYLADRGTFFEFMDAQSKTVLTIASDIVDSISIVKSRSS